MKKKLLAIVLAALCLNFTAEAQSQTNEIKPLKIGDTIPEEIWKMPLQVINHPTGKQILTLNDYRDKQLIILDFWATWCSPCIASIERLSPIYEEYSDDIMLLPVASHQGQAVPQAVALMNEKKWKMPSVIDQGQYLFKKIFPPAGGRGIPHMIWIKENRVIAVGESGYATKENILKVIKGQPFAMVMDTAVIRPLDYSRPLFVEGNGKTGVYFRKGKNAVIARYLPGYGTGRKTAFINKGDSSILAAVNRSLPALLFDAYHLQIFPNLDAKTGIIWKISDSLKNRLFNGPKYDKTQDLTRAQAYKDWLKHNTYGYNLRYPENICEMEAFYFMQQDLKRFFQLYMNLTFSIQPYAKHRYAVLRPSISTDHSQALLAHKDQENARKSADTAMRYNKHYTQIFVRAINDALTGLTIPAVIDSTGVSKNLKVDFALPNNIKGNPDILTAALKRYGIDLFIRETDVPVLVVTEQKPTNQKIIRKKH